VLALLLGRARVPVTVSPRASLVVQSQLVMLLVPLVVVMAGAFVTRQVAAFGEHVVDV
jgi:hypothetical protein